MNTDTELMYCAVTVGYFELSKTCPIYLDKYLLW